MDSASSGGVSRRQALNACDTCRKRKTKCDEDKPSCGRCRRMNLDCSYAETVAVARSITVAELVRTLGKMDEKLEAMHAMMQHGPSQGLPSTASPGIAQPQMTSPQLSFHSPQYHDLAPPSMISYFDTGRMLEELSLSQKHVIAPQHLYTWPCSPLTLNEVDLQYPLRVEVGRPRLPEFIGVPRFIGSSPETDHRHWLLRLTPSQLNYLVFFYFAHYHPFFLILDEARFHSHDLSLAARTDFSQSYSTCLVLWVCALGSIVARYSEDGIRVDTDGSDMDIAFFTLADRMLHSLETSNWETVQCLLLKGLYYDAKFRVYDAWNATHQACSIIKILVPLQEKLGYQQCQLFWVAYIMESQMLAEFDFPSSGLGNLAGNMDLPLHPDDGMASEQAEYQLFFLATIAARKLLNRILFHVYKRGREASSRGAASGQSARPDNAMHFGASHAMTSELDRQLEEWRLWLPAPLQFIDRTHEVDQIAGILDQRRPRTTADKLRGHLTGRFYAAKSIIHRQLLFRALNCGNPATLTEQDLAGARTALHAGFLLTVYGGMAHEPLPLLQHPLNKWKATIAVEIQMHFVKASNLSQLTLPPYWSLVSDVRRKMAADAAASSSPSPTIERDAEILEMLAASYTSPG